ncbi:endonuclease MutS2 [Candidatus Latescibacterota bacterium]
MTILLSYNRHVLRVLEFEPVREIVSTFADSEEGKSGLAALVPLKDTETARKLLAETGEIMTAVRFDDPVSAIAVRNIRGIFPRLKVPGSFLSIEEIAAVGDNLELADDISGYFGDKAEKYHIISSITSEIVCHPEIHKNIRKMITPDLEIDDNATPELRSIRRKLNSTRNALRKSIEKRLAGLSEDIISERIVTIRDGRHVIPVRDSMKKHVPGAVHDRSQSGKTLFIEPLDTIEANNQVRELELAEQAEIHRILIILSDSISEIVDDLEQNQDTLVRLDMISAKARFGVRVEGVIPKIADEPVVDISGGRHPLLDWKFRKEGNIKTVVPLNIKIGGQVRTMVITGPNAGGKTVALKTFGLILLMALSGIPVTAGPNTSVYAPPEFFADIGDEQSIEDDLSTFSSHIKQIVTILKSAGPNTLVLLDELGGGTNPSDGEAIALAVLKKLTGVGAVTIATSHHDSLKVFAHEAEGVKNASMEFDTKNHVPTFVLRTGVPGSSYAFEIAARMGMPADVLGEVESIGGSEKKSLEGLISEMEEHARQAEKDRKTAESERLKAETARKEYELKLEEIIAHKKEKMSEALTDAKKIIEDTNRQMELIIKSMRESKSSHDAIVEAKAIIGEARETLKKKSTVLNPKPKKKRKPLGTLEKGMTVWAESLGSNAVVEDILSGGSKARIRVGKSKAAVVVDAKNLSAADISQKEKPQSVVINVPARQISSMEINLLGMTFEEAKDMLDTFLADLNTSGLDTAHIIHGKGTGALRSKIGKYLDKHEHVESWRLGDWNEGSSGVTIAKLKE